MVPLAAVLNGLGGVIRAWAYNRKVHKASQRSSPELTQDEIRQRIAELQKLLAAQGQPRE